MTLPSDSGTSDIWLDWLTHGRHGNDAEAVRRVQMLVQGYADRVIDGAGLKRGMTLLDLGAGDGLVAFRAIDRVGESLRVILVDISAPLLALAEQNAIARGIREQCTFLASSAEQLNDLADDSVDAVTARSSLAYVADKCASLRECFRVLKPGGKLSIAEPVFRDNALAAAALKKKLESGQFDPNDWILPLWHRWQAAQYPDTLEGIQNSPITNYTERDLLQLAQTVGFRELQLELHIGVSNSYRKTWDALLDSSPHPLAPSLRTVLRESFSAEERQRFERVVRPMAENGDLPETDRMAYLTALKPLNNRS